MTIFLQALIGAVAGAIVSGLCWWLFQRQVQRDDSASIRMEEDLRKAKADITDLRDHRIARMESDARDRLAAQESQLRDKIADLARRADAEAAARRALESEMVKQREWMILRDELRAMSEKLDKIGREVTGVQTNVATIMENVKLDFGKVRT